MYTFKDLDVKTVFVINCIEHERSLRVMNGELLLEEKNGEKNKTLTKIPFQKLLALFVIGHLTVTAENGAYPPTQNGLIHPQLLLKWP